MLMSMDYAQMIEGCRRHDRKAQRALYDAMVQMSMGVCMRFANDRDEAQDMLQDAFVKVFERIASLKEPEGLPSWVRSIVVNTCIDYYRRRRYWLPIDGECEPPSNLNIDPFATEEVVLAMQRLTPAQRTVFNLCEVEGYTQEEVAKKLNTNKLAVRVALHRAREQLKIILSNKQ